MKISSKICDRSPRRFGLCGHQPRPGAQGQEQRRARGAGNAGPPPPRRRREYASASRLGCTVQQRQPRRTARMRDRAERGSDQDRPVDRADQYPRAQPTPARRSRWSNCRSGSICRPAPNSRSTTARRPTCRSRPARRAAATPTSQISPDVLAALKSGKQLKVSFQNLAKETITIPMPLADFAAAYEKIK